ncbi:putative reverse transcriptase domain-containing protein [Tanacetum coccineum]
MWRLSDLDEEGSGLGTDPAPEEPYEVKAPGGSCWVDYPTMMRGQRWESMLVQLDPIENFSLQLEWGSSRWRVVGVLGLGGASVSVMPLSTYLNLGLGELAHTRLTVELADRTVKYPKGIVENILVEIGKFTFPLDFIILDMPKDIKVLLILGRPFLSTACAKIDVYKRKITLRVGEEKIIFKSIKPASSLIKRVYMLSLRERMELDLEARLMGETLVLNRSLDPFLEDYIELNDLNEPFELRRNQGDDLMPTIEEGEVIKEFRTRDEDLDIGIDDYPSYCDDDKKIHIDCAHNLNFRANIDMDAYRDEGMGDIIVGEPFLREVGIKAKRFEGIITLYNGDDEVTYQMGFFKGVLNLGTQLITYRKCGRRKNGSHAGTLACMRPNKVEAEENSNLKTSL